MQMRTYFFPTHVYVCAVQDQGFFLDLKRNEYLSAPLQELRRLSRVVQGWPAELGAWDVPGEEASSAIESTMAELARNHILCVKPSRIPRLELLPGPSARQAILEVGATEYPPVFRFYLLSFLKAALVATYFLSFRSLYSAVRRIERRQARNAAVHRSFDTQKTRRLVEIFKRLQPLLPPTRTPCLVRSLVLLEFLAAYGQFPRLVFGVQAHPFNAHCWIQQDDVVFNSTLEHVLQFTPMNGRCSA
jgi:hypothetical protein